MDNIKQQICWWISKNHKSSLWLGISAQLWGKSGAGSGQMVFYNHEKIDPTAQAWPGQPGSCLTQRQSFRITSLTFDLGKEAVRRVWLNLQLSGVDYELPSCGCWITCCCCCCGGEARWRLRGSSCPRRPSSRWGRWPRSPWRPPAPAGNSSGLKHETMSRENRRKLNEIIW